jgi:hypothetical protein
MAPQDGQSTPDAANPADSLAGWRYLANEAKAGRLVLDPTVAGDCAVACDTLIAGLRKLRQEVQFWNLEVGVGNFRCGTALSRLLQDAAMGGGGLHERLGEHIQVVSLIRETITGQVTQMVETDEHAATSIANAPK